MIDRLRLALVRMGLPAWFVAIDLLWIAEPDVLGIDARHYQRAVSAWLNGTDPWVVTESGVGFAAEPHTLLFYAPTALLPPGLRSLDLADSTPGTTNLVGRVPAPRSRDLER